MRHYMHGERDENFVLKLVSFNLQLLLFFNLIYEDTITYMKSFYPSPNNIVVHRGNTKYFNTKFINGNFGVVLIFKLVHLCIFVTSGFGGPYS